MKHKNKKTPVSVIVTVLNEEKTINSLLHALFSQTLPPAEIIITDADSTDRTVEFIRNFAKDNPQISITLESFASNRSQGRNRAIELAQQPLIAITDAGCIPAHNWLEELVRTFSNWKNERPEDDRDPVIAGYAVGQPKTSLQKAAVPYFLVMPDKINPESYLPATRSMLISKKTWLNVGGFNQKLNSSEDYIFAKKLEAKHVPILFNKDAEVKWFLPNTFWQMLKTFKTFADWDIQGGILRPKVVFLLVRYFVGVLLFLFLLWAFHPLIMFIYVISSLAIYSFWAVRKNERYVGKAWYWLPALQIGADAAVILGTLQGYMNARRKPQLIQSAIS